MPLLFLKEVNWKAKHEVTCSPMATELQWCQELKSEDTGFVDFFGVLTVWDTNVSWEMLCM